MHVSATTRRMMLGSCLTLTACGMGLLLADGPAAKVPPTAKAQPPVPVAAAADADPHYMFGGSIHRNMVNIRANGLKLPPAVAQAEDPAAQAAAQKKWDAEWVHWRASLGSLSYGGPIISGGKVFVGTNNDNPRNKRDRKMIKDPDTGEVTIEPIDRGIVMCFDEKTGAFLWQAVHDKLPSGQVNDWPHEGVCSTATVDGNRIYYVSNQCRVVCADVNGFADGNQGYDKEKYQTPTDADIIWDYDMIKGLDVFPHNMSACCPLIVGDTIFVVTANGVNEDHTNIPAPLAPSFIALDKHTGKVLWHKNYPGRNIMHGQWSNPTYAVIGGTPQVIFPGGDGWLYGLNPASGDIIWKFDCNPKDAVYELGGSGTKSDFIGTPVVQDGRVYIGTGQDPEHTTGIAWFRCIAPTKTGDISPTLDTGTKDKDGKPVEKPNPNSCQVWVYGGVETRMWAEREFKFGRTMSSAAVVDNIVYIPELTGILHCLDATTGKQFWEFDTKASIWGSAYVVDGKVFLGNDQGEVYVFRHTKTPETIDLLDFKAPDRKAAQAALRAKKDQVRQKYLLAKLTFDAPVRSTPVVANNTLYVMTEKTLHALKVK